MYKKISNDLLEEQTKNTFKDINWTEADLERFLRNNIEMISGDESMLIVGQQVKNKSMGRTDLVAVDTDGSLVLIEIKRDKKDSAIRTEAFEMQAIRYAASIASIQTLDEMIIKIFAPFIRNYPSEFNLEGRTPEEYAKRVLERFLNENHAEKTFNAKQKIILVASEIDEQTKSAVAWLNQNNVDISCFELDVYKIENEIYINPRKILPVERYNDFYVEIYDSKETRRRSMPRIKRQQLPRIDELILNKVVNPGDIIKPKDHPGEGILLANGNVDAHGEEMSMQVWLKNIYGWASIQTYVFAIHQKTGKSLSQLRKEYMDKAEEELLQGNED